MRKENSLNFLKPYLRPYRLQFIAGPACKLVEAVLELLMPLFMARVIDGASFHGNDMGFFLRKGGSLLILVVLGMLFSFSCQYMASLASQGVGTLLRNDVFDRAQRFSFAQLDRYGAPSLANRLTIDINNIQFAVAMSIRLLIRAPFLCIGGSILAFYISPGIAVLMLISIPAAAVLLAKVMGKSLPLVRLAQKGTDKLGRLISDHLSGVRIIRAFNRSEHEREYFADSNDEVTDYLERAGKISALMNPGTVFIVNAAIVIALYLGGGLVQSGELLPGEMIALINYFMQVLLAMTVTANLVMAVPRTLASAERLKEVLSEEEELKELPADDEACAVRRENSALLEADGLTYRYSPEARPVLDKVDVKINPGEFIGIIGSTGSGKSSLARLLQRFYDPQSGRVFFDGRDIRCYAREEISRRIAFVPQKSQLFSASIRENVCLGLDEKSEDYPSDEALARALKTAQAYDFVSEKDGALDYHVERGGRNLSGGQKQRLCIARALVRHPEILILDDSASALDYKTEAALLHDLAAWPEEMAVVLISQRVHSIQNAERIYVMDEGRIAAAGSHEELLIASELYRDIVNTQKRLTDEETENAEAEERRSDDGREILPV